MQCNIDAKGKVVRLISGSLVLMVGVLLMAVEGDGFAAADNVAGGGGERVLRY